MGAKRYNEVVDIHNRKRLERRLLSVKLAPKARISLHGATPVKSPMRLILHKCRLALQLTRTTGVRVMSVRSVARAGGRGRQRRPVTRPNIKRLKGTQSCHGGQVNSAVPGKRPVAFTLTNGRGYKGAALFGRLANSGRRINGFPNMAISGGRKDVQERPRTAMASLPKVCSLSPCSDRRVMAESFLLGRGPAKVVGVMSTSGVREGLCLAVRLVRLKVPVILTLGVVSRMETGKNSIQVGRLRRVLKVPIMPVSTTGGRKVSRLVSRTIRITECERTPKEVSFYASGRSPGSPMNTLREYVRTTIRLVRPCTGGTKLPMHFTTAGVMRGSSLVRGHLTLPRNRGGILSKLMRIVRGSNNLSHRTTLTGVHFGFVRGLYRGAIMGPTRDHRRGQDITVSHVLAKGCATVPYFIKVVTVMFIVAFGCLKT